MEADRNSGSRVATTTNLSFAGYVHMHGLRLVAAKAFRAARGTEYTFSFEDPDERWNALRLAFVNSEAQRHDQAVRALKSMCRDNRK
jgi:hypothetical protein